jgi:hypothetical protein
MSKIEVNQISSQCGSTLTVGQSGDTVTLACGATAAGFGSTGEVSWNTTKITADPGNAVSGVGYFTDTSGGAFNVTLPSSPSAGNVVAVADYANTWDTNNLTIARNGSNIEGDASDFVCNQEGATITFVYVDATKGWICINSGNSSNAFVSNYIVATGGTITCCGDYRIHTFTGPGTFCVTSEGTPAGSTLVDYLVVAGGGGGRGVYGGGGGAGGFRESPGTASGCYSVSPLGTAPAVSLPVSIQGYPIVVGAGGGAPATSSSRGIPGSNSTFSTIISTGGGGSGAGDIPSPISDGPGLPGGSGGGGGGFGPGTRISGNGNTPPVSPPQGQNGGCATAPAGGYGSGGGGGATAVGSSVTYPGSGGSAGGPGGAGATTSISGSPTAYAGGGGGGGWAAGGGTGGVGGGADGLPNGTPGTSNGTVNTGGGGGGGGIPSNIGTGGSGIVIIRYKFQN